MSRGGSPAWGPSAPSIGSVFAIRISQGGSMRLRTDTLLTLATLLLCELVGPSLAAARGSARPTLTPLAEPGLVGGASVSPRPVPFRAAHSEAAWGTRDSSGGATEPSRHWAVAAQVGMSVSLPSFNLALEGSRRWEHFGVLVKADWNPWIDTQHTPVLTVGTLNLGLGAEYRYFSGRVRTAVVAGPSILLFRTPLDEPGKVGFFLDCYASSLDWSITGPLHLRFDPLSFHIVAPILDSIPLVVFEYRTSVALEWRF